MVNKSPAEPSWEEQDERIPAQGTLERKTEAWRQRRNQRDIRVHWRFTTADVCIKLKSLYPSVQTWWAASGAGRHLAEARDRLPSDTTGKLRLFWSLKLSLGRIEEATAWNIA